MEAALALVLHKELLGEELLYPAVLLAVLLTVVLPVFNDVYAQLGGQLTGFAGWLLALGMGLKALLPVLLLGFHLSEICRQQKSPTVKICILTVGDFFDTLKHPVMRPGAYL